MATESLLSPSGLGSSSLFSLADPSWNNALIVRPADPEDDKKYTLNDLCPDTLGEKEGMLLNYVRKLVKSVYPRIIKEYNWKFWGPHNTIRSLSELGPFLTSTKIKPDVFIEYTLDKTNGKKSTIPLLLMEVVSASQFTKSVAKSAANCIDQLRYLRNFYDISSIVGYVVPGVETKACAISLTVEWKDFQFSISYEYIKSGDFKEHLIKLLESQCLSLCQCQRLKRFSPMNFMTLSSKDLETLRSHTLLPNESHGSLEQQESKYSILTKDSDFFYKIIPRVADFLIYPEIIWKIRDTDHKTLSKLRSRIVLPDHIFYVSLTRLQIVRFERQPHGPLRKEQAKNCLGELLKGTKEALDALHSWGYAHTDVRLENLCFSRDGKVKLIDLDRLTLRFQRCPSCSKSFMSNSKNSMEHLDWKQLGLMILCIPYEDVHQTQISEDTARELCENEPFLRELIFTEVYDNSLVDEFITNHPGSILEVLTS